MKTTGRAVALGLFAAGLSSAAALPGHYYRLLEIGCDSIEKYLQENPGADLKALERNPRWTHFGYAILPPAVLYAREHPENRRYHDPKMLALAIQIGDLLATEDEKDTFEPRLDSDWDAYMWLETYRLLGAELGEARRERWKRQIVRNVALLVPGALERIDYAWYQTPFIGTSPNHYAQWAALLLLGGQVFGNSDWEKLGTRILKRFATTEQSADGYWGENNNSGPTTGYNHLTLSSVGLYWELTHDSDALPALRRATTFHENFTFLDGTPVDAINDRNRHWGLAAWGHFTFSNFADGRGYAEFLADFFERERPSVNHLGRIAQDTLYYHEGPIEAAPQTLAKYSYRMSVPAGVRKTGPWQVVLSGLMSGPLIDNQYYLDRQGHISVFHQKAELIITGAGSKRQPELATFSERLMGQEVHMPVSTRLEMAEQQDRLSLGYNTFFCDLYVPAPEKDEIKLRFAIAAHGRPADEARLTLQLALRTGEMLETGAGKKLTLGAERIELGPAELGGWIRHHGWTIKVDPTARLVWPVYPFNPYANASETSLEWAVGALSVELHSERKRREQHIEFVISTK